MLSAEEVKRVARKMGADLVGITPAQAINENPPDPRWPQTPSRIWEECQSVIALAKRIPWGMFRSQDSVVRRYTPPLVMSRLDGIALNLSYFLEEHGHYAFPAPQEYTDTNLKSGSYGPLSLRHVAIEAGLGTLGLNMLLITPQYGPRVYVTAVLTNAYLEPDGRLEKPLCAGPKCGRCLLACPADAVLHWGLEKRRCSTRAQPSGIAQLLRHLEALTFAETQDDQKRLIRSVDTINFWQATLHGVGAYASCHRCLETCPIGQDYKHLKDIAPKTIPEATPEKLGRLKEMRTAEKGGEMPLAANSRRWIGRKAV